MIFLKNVFLLLSAIVHHKALVVYAMFKGHYGSEDQRVIAFFCFRLNFLLICFISVQKQNKKNNGLQVMACSFVFCFQISKQYKGRLWVVKW